MDIRSEKPTFIYRKGRNGFPQGTQRDDLFFANFAVSLRTLRFGVDSKLFFCYLCHLNSGAAAG
jgi:hypothetical protein